MLYRLPARKSRRGSAILAVLFAAAAVAALLLAVLSRTHSSQSVTRESDNYAAAVAAAEYGAGLAAAQVTAGLLAASDENDKGTVIGDWVYGQDGTATLFTAGGTAAADQRRIAGVFGDHEFRVRVRSARLAHDSNNNGAGRTMPVTWLADPGKYVYGADRDYKFSDIYEITATAQNTLSGSAGAALTARPVIQTVIGVRSSSPLGQIMNEVGVGHVEIPQNFQLRSGTSDKLVTDTDGMPMLASTDSVAVTGEDHMLRKYRFPIFEALDSSGSGEGGGQVIRYLSGTDMDLYRARHRYWRYGKLTVHRRTDLENRDYPNPFRPATTNFHKSGSWHWLTDKESAKEGVVYTKEMFLNDKQSMIALHDGVSRDDYLMGGKGSGSTGRTVTLYTDENGELRIYETKHSQASKWGDNFFDDSDDDDWWYGGSDEDDDDGEDDDDDDEEDDGDEDDSNEKYPGNEDGGGDHEDEDDDESGEEIVHDLMVARAEDMSRLYINVAAVSPVDRDGVMGITSKTDMDRLEAKFGAAQMEAWKQQILFKGMHLPTRVKEWWYQNFVGQYTDGGVKAKKLYKAFPHVAPKEAQHVRPLNLFILTRPYSKKAGEQRRLMLVREYVRRDKKTGQITGLTAKWHKDSHKTWHWEGTYTWVPVKMEFRSGGVICMHVKKSVHSGAHTVPRLFTWQELTGYSLEKRTGGSFAGEPAVDADNNTRFRLADGKRVPVGFDEYHQQGDFMGYQPLEDTVPPTKAEIAGFEPFMDSKRGKKLDFREVRQTADRRVIWVRDHAPILAASAKKREALHAVLSAKPNHGLVPHTALEDFAFDHVFTDGTREVTHKVVGVTVAMEAKQEQMFHNGTDSEYKKAKADPSDGRTIKNSEYKRIYDNEGFRYNGMVFNVYIAPKMLEERGSGSGEPAERMASLEWWEREEADGLTGLQAIPAISTNKEETTLAERNVTNANYGLLGHSPRDDQHFLNSMYSAATNGVDYRKMLEDLYGPDDAADRELLPSFSPGFPRAEFGEGAQAGILTEACLERTRRNTELAANRRENGKPVYFYYTKTDLMNVCYTDTAAYFSSDGTPDLERALEYIRSVNPSYITLGDGIVTADLRFADIGSRWDLEDTSQGILRAAKTYDPSESGDVPQTSYKVLPNALYARRIAGEAVGYTLQDVPAMQTENLRPVTQITQSVRLGFLAGELLQDTDSDTLRTDGAVPVREITGRTQADGTSVTVRDFTAASAAAAVAKCYVDYYENDSVTRAKVQELYGLKDQRRSIGFHRFGPEETYRDIYGQDHYEIVLLGVSGFNPYKTALTGSEQYVALEKNDDGDERGQQFKYSDDAEAYVKVPDFVFSQPIDGAGTMVVNGNLVIRSRFAYHGTLIVLGDVIIDPVLNEETMVYGQDGNAVGEYGNSLFLQGGQWHYTWKGSGGKEKVSAVYLDSKGDALKDAAGNTIAVKPFTVPAYDSELVLQGNLLLKGRIVNNTVPDSRDTAAAGDEVSGRVRLFWSSDAVENTAESWAENKIVYDRTSWTHNDSIDVESIWTDTHDPVRQ